MNSIFTRMLSLYRNVRSKIAFYPTLFALSGLIFALVMMYLEKMGISGYLVENAPLLVVNSGDTALAILSACRRSMKNEADIETLDRLSIQLQL